MRKRPLYIILITLFLLGFKQTQPENPWLLKKYESGIAIFTRTAENSKYKELKSVVQLKTSLSSIVALLNDWESYPQWVYKCGKSTILKKISETEVIHYQTVTAPWPVDNRDFVVNVAITQDPVTKVVYQKATCIPDFIPRVPQHVRITEFKALWTITPLKDGVVNIEYQLLVNPGGSIPAWLVNLAVVDGPFETAYHLKSRVMEDKYQKAVIPYIKEL